MTDDRSLRLDSVPGETVRFEPRGAAATMMRSKADTVLMSGAAGTGKSVPCMMKLHLICLSVPRVRCLVVRKTLTSLTASTLVSFREKVAAEAIARGIVKWFGGSSQKPAAYQYSNGSEMVVGGLDHPIRLMSTEYDMAFFDEAIEGTPEDVETITVRLRNGRLPYQQLVMATNPGGPTHHLKAMERDGRLLMLYSKHEDNPQLYRAGRWTERGLNYLAKLDKLTGARFHRLRWGRWVASEGMVYEAWDPAVHVVDPFRPPDSWERWWSVDFGFTNPMVIACWAEDPDGRLWLYRETYRTRRIVSDQARDMLALVATETKPGKWEWHEPMPRAVVCDHDAEGRVVLSQELDVGTIPAIKGVADGIQGVQRRLELAGDGKPRLFVMRGARVHKDPELEQKRLPTCTEEEFPSYVWLKPGAGAAVQAPKEVPLAENNHGMDQTRYVVAERDVGAPGIRSM